VRYIWRSTNHVVLRLWLINHQQLQRSLRDIIIWIMHSTSHFPQQQQWTGAMPAILGVGINKTPYFWVGGHSGGTTTAPAVHPVQGAAEQGSNALNIFQRHRSVLYNFLLSLEHAASCIFKKTRNSATADKPRYTFRGQSRSPKVRYFSYGFLLVCYSNFVPKTHRFWDIRLVSIQWPWNPG